jgi:hypothetical protein
VKTSQHLDPAALLTALYCTVDDLYRDQFAERKPVRPGRRPKLSDSEVLTLVLLAQWRQDRSERAFLAYAMAHLRPYFPRLLHQSAFNRRARDLMGVLCALGPAIRQRAIAVLGMPQPAYEVLDGVPVPLMRRCRGVQHRLFRDEAAIGRGGSDKEWYYGVKLLGAVDAHGFISGFVAGPANTEERWLAEALFRWRQDPHMPIPSSAELVSVLGPTHRAGGQRQGPTGPLGPRPGVGEPSQLAAIADLNYAGAAWSRHWRDDYGVTVLTEAEYRDLPMQDRRQASRWLHGLRQTVETAFGQLVGRFGLKFPRARTLWGLYTRLGAKMAAHNLSLYLNHLLGRPPFSACDPLA